VGSRRIPLVLKTTQYHFVICSGLAIHEIGLFEKLVRKIGLEARHQEPIVSIQARGLTFTRLFPRPEAFVEGPIEPHVKSWRGIEPTKVVEAQEVEPGSEC
jgi:hypothetical protein